MNLNTKYEPESEQDNNNDALECSPTSAKRLRCSDEVPANAEPAAVEPVGVPMVKDLSSWNFDIFEYNEKTNSAFKDISYSVIKMFDVDKTLKTDDQTVLNWLDLVERTYEAEVPYHNSIHAADVLQAVAFFLKVKWIKDILSSTDTASLVIATIVHDIHHPGYVSAALKNLNHRVWFENASSSLESHHVQKAFEVTSENERSNIFKELDQDTFSWFKTDISDLILATDMDKHKEYSSRFIETVTAATLPDKSIDWQIIETENKLLIKQILLKNADVATSQRPLQIHIRWTEKICREFHRQTEAELQHNVEPTYPEFKEICVIPEAQIVFLEMVKPMIEEWDRLLELPELREHFNRTLKFWGNFRSKPKYSFDEIQEALKAMV